MFMSTITESFTYTCEVREKEDIQRYRDDSREIREIREIREEADRLLKAKKNLERELEDFHHELEWYKNNEDEQNDYKTMLDELMNHGVIDEEYKLN